ncbi:MAG: hypothetical protein KF843_02505 [Flavobacteriales bacterium]|nr:hypothetical protein [Flavobacteriales bacterium]
MKTPLTLSLLFAAAGLFAQPTIQQFSFVPGTTIVVDNEFPISSAGASGAKVTWDYSSLAFSSEEITYVAQAIATIEGADQFPGATGALVVEADGLADHFFFDFMNGIAEHGELLSGGGDDMAIIYSDPMVMCATPLALGASGSDSFAYNIPITGMPASYTGGISWNVDAYGTLKLPNATYTDVIRVHSMAYDTIVTHVGGSQVITNGLEETWSWFKSGYPMALLTYSILSDEFGTETGATEAIISITVPTELDEGRLLAPFAHPNPTSGTCMVSFPSAEAPSVNLLNATGQVILEQGLKGVAPTLQVDFTDHAVGAYVLDDPRDRMTYYFSTCPCTTKPSLPRKTSATWSASGGPWKARPAGWCRIA